MEQYLNLYIVLQCILFSLAISRTGKREDKLLAAFLLFTGLVQGARMILVAYSLTSNLWNHLLEVVALYNCVIFIQYSGSLLNKPFAEKQRYLWLIPPIYFCLSLAVFFLNFYQIVSDDTYFHSYLAVSLIKNIAWLAYLIYLNHLFGMTLASQQVGLSHLQRIKIYWGKWAVIFILLRTLLLCIYLITFYYLRHNDPLLDKLENNYQFLTNLILSALLMMLVYLSLRNPNVFNDPEETGTIEQRIVETVLPAAEKTVSQKVKLSVELYEQYVNIISKAMDEEKCYLQNEWNQRQFSAQTGIPVHHLSYIINQHWEKNFNEFMNGYRVEYAKMLLSNRQPTDDTMYAIAIDSGFGSEARFYAIFKKATGFTPKQFKTQMLSK